MLIIYVSYGRDITCYMDLVIKGNNNITRFQKWYKDAFRVNARDI